MKLLHGLSVMLIIPSMYFVFWAFDSDSPTIMTSATTISVVGIVLTALGHKYANHNTHVHSRLSTNVKPAVPINNHTKFKLRHRVLLRVLMVVATAGVLAGVFVELFNPDNATTKIIHVLVGGVSSAIVSAVFSVSFTADLHLRNYGERWIWCSIVVGLVILGLATLSIIMITDTIYETMGLIAAASSIPFLGAAISVILVKRFGLISGPKE